MLLNKVLRPSVQGYVFIYNTTIRFWCGIFCLKKQHYKNCYSCRIVIGHIPIPHTICYLLHFLYYIIMCILSKSEGKSNENFSILSKKYQKKHRITLILISFNKKCSFMSLNFLFFAFKYNFINMNNNPLNRVKVVLVEKQRTSKWLAEQLGVTPATVSKWCTNTSQPDLQTLARIAELLGCEKRQLITE